MIKKEFYKDFKPELSPKKMLELGVFGGSYFGSNIKEYPKTWFKKAKLSKNFDVSLNCFKVKSGLSRDHWIKKRMDFQRRSSWMVSVVLSIFNGSSYSSYRSNSNKKMEKL